MNNLCPKSAVASSSQSVPDSLSDPRPNPLPFPALKPYNQSHMQPALSARISDGFMAAIWLGGEKPHQGVSSRNQAWHPAPNVCNSTTALGLQAGCAGNRVRSFCSGEQYDSDLSLYYLRARYYNPQTGRFLSRDPENGKPTDPKTLHKYLYASGNPVNRIDPRGREDLVEYAETVVEAIRIDIAIACYMVEYISILEDFADGKIPLLNLGPGTVTWTEGGGWGGFEWEPPKNPADWICWLSDPMPGIPGMPPDL